jgi:hypothetical protein
MLYCHYTDFFQRRLAFRTNSYFLRAKTKSLPHRRGTRPVCLINFPSFQNLDALLHPSGFRLAVTVNR